MSKDLISVIVPVYNVKEYLERCFASIVKQTYTDLEIILVDDGSTDGSGVLCDELKKRDIRVRVIHKANGGLGSARNAGIAHARGTYFGFVDSDDWIKPEMYENMLNLMKKYDAQICACGIQRVTESGDVSFYNDVLDELRIFSAEEALNELPRNERISNSMCNKLFRKETVVGLTINEQIAYEDNPFTPQCVARTQKVVYTSVPFYCYFERRGSLSRSSFSVREFDRVTADRMRLEYYHEHFPMCEDAAAIAFIGTCLKVFYQARGNGIIKEKKKLLEKELRMTIQKYRDLPYTEKQRAKVRLFMLCPTLYSVAMIIRKR